MRSAAPTYRACAIACACVLSCAPLRPKPAPDGGVDLACTTPSGAPVRLGGPGPVRLVEVWATWCEPCQKAAPIVKRVLERHPRVVGYSLSIDDDSALLLRWIEEHEVPGRPLVLKGGFSAAHRRGIDEIPFAFALDTNGRAIGSLTGLMPHSEALLERMVSAAEGAVEEPR